MPPIRATLAALLALFAIPAGAQTAPAPKPEITPAEAAAIHQAIERGRLLYFYDQAAWHGTDDMLAKIPSPETVVGGWIVDGPADHAELVFYDKDKADPHAVYVATFTGNRLVSSRVLGQGDDRTLSPARKALIAARRAALEAAGAAGLGPCAAQKFNTVVLPPEAPGAAVLVYLLSPQTSNESIPLGGHYRIEVSADGKAGAPHPFSKSCLTIPKDGSKTAALTVTHLLDPQPTEIHVFSMLAAQLPIIVMTMDNEKLWAVEGTGGYSYARIRLIDPSEIDPKK